LYCKKLSVLICNHLAFDAPSQKESAKKYFSKAIFITEKCKENVYEI